MNYKSLQKLDLDRTEITCLGAKAIGSLLEANHELQKVYLKWNKIRGQGGIYIAQGLKLNGGLKRLDLSWNSLGSGKQGSLGSEWG